VVPKEQLGSIEPGALQRQFARTPYAVSFHSGERTFILFTLHVLYGENEEERIPEIRAIPQWLAQWAMDINGWDYNLIALGDFNIDRKGDTLYDGFVSTGLNIPDDLQDAPRTIFSDPEKPELNKFYDQIAWFTGRNSLPALSLQYSEGGIDNTGVDEGGAFLAHLRSLPAMGRILYARLATFAQAWNEYSLRSWLARLSSQRQA
jgi:hypothetical protein